MLSDDEFRKLLQFFNRPWAGYRKVRKGVKKRVRRHMQELGCTAIEHYLQVLARQQEQRAICEQHLIVTISRFFRDRPLWEYLKTKIIPELLHRFDGPIRVWSAGCANGEEAYSLCMLWESLKIGRALEILASDANASVLDRARQGVYLQSSLKELPDELKQQFFDPQTGSRGYVIQTQRLPQIEWKQHNLFHPPPPGPFHLIFLRNNLLTYYQEAAMQTVFEAIVGSLVPNGYLVVGSHEHLPPAEVILHREKACQWAYKKGQEN